MSHVFMQGADASNKLLTLWSRETVRWPAKRMSVCAQDGVFLLHAKPRVLVVHHVHHLLTRDPQVGFCRGSMSD